MSTRVMQIRAVDSLSLSSLRMSLPTFDTWFRALPPVVMVSIAVMWTIHIVRTLTGYVSVSNFALMSHLEGFTDLYRLATGPFLHGDGLHIALNSLAFVRTGVKLENDLGTVIYFVLQTWCVLIPGILYLLVMGMFRTLDPQNSGWTYQTVVGFSACLFALFVIEVETAADEGQPLLLFGRLSIPRRLVPWFMIFVIQLFVPQVSFLGHVCGAMAGLLLSRGLGIWVLPSRDKAAAIDDRVAGCFVKVLGRYKPVYSRGNTNPFERSAANPLSCCSMPSGPLLPLSVPEANEGAQPPSTRPAFPTTGGRRLGSS